MVGRMVSALVIGISLLGCSALPYYWNDPRISPADVVGRVQCELKRAAELPTEKPIDLKEYSAGFTVTMTAEFEISPNLSADWTIPYHLTDTLSAGFKAGVTDNAWREGSIDYSVNIADLDGYQCPEYLELAYQQDPRSAELTYGSFGVVNWFKTITSTLTKGPAAPKGPMSYSVKFAVTSSGSASPGFKVVNLNGTVNLPAKRTDTHKLALTFARNAGPTPEPEPVKVCVTNMPGATSCERREEKRPPDKAVTVRPVAPKKPRAIIGPRGVPSSTQQQLNQQLDILRLRDALRP